MRAIAIEHRPPEHGSEAVDFRGREFSPSVEVANGMNQAAALKSANGLDAYARGIRESLRGERFR